MGGGAGDAAGEAGRRAGRRVRCACRRLGTGGGCGECCGAGGAGRQSRLGRRGRAGRGRFSGRAGGVSAQLFSSDPCRLAVAPFWESLRHARSQGRCARCGGPCVRPCLASACSPQPAMSALSRGHGKQKGSIGKWTVGAPGRRALRHVRAPPPIGFAIYPTTDPSVSKCRFLSIASSMTNWALGDFGPGSPGPCRALRSSSKVAHSGAGNTRCGPPSPQCGQPPSQGLRLFGQPVARIAKAFASAVAWPCLGHVRHPALSLSIFGTPG